MKKLCSINDKRRVDDKVAIVARQSHLLKPLVDMVVYIKERENN